MIGRAVLVEATTKFLKQNKIYDFEVFNLVPFDNPKSPWMNICFDIIKKNNFDVALSIQKMWNGNIDYFQNEVLEHLVIIDSYYENGTESSVLISFGYDEWMALLKHTCVNGNGRISFKAILGDSMSFKLQKCGINCWLRHNFNGIYKKESNNYWVGKYHCILHDSGCEILYDALVKNPPVANRDVIMRVAWRGIVEHAVLDKPARCSGEKRKLAAHFVTSVGVQNAATKYRDFNDRTGKNGKFLLIFEL